MRTDDLLRALGEWFVPHLAAGHAMARVAPDLVDWLRQHLATPDLAIAWRAQPTAGWHVAPADWAWVLELGVRRLAAPGEWLPIQGKSVEWMAGGIRVQAPLQAILMLPESGDPLPFLPLLDLRIQAGVAATGFDEVEEMV
jgi:hypothetical protein